MILQEDWKNFLIGKENDLKKKQLKNYRKENQIQLWRRKVDGKGNGDKAIKHFSGSEYLNMHFSLTHHFPFLGSLGTPDNMGMQALN